MAITLIFFFTSFLSYALDAVSLTISPHAGFTYGQFDEILYDSDGKMCSLLEWEQKPLLNFGLTADIQIQRFILSSSFEYGLKPGNPQMHDSDWNDGIKYSYTTHPLKSSKEINTELSLIYQLYSDYMISILPEFQIQYMYDSFNADKGSGKRYGNELRVYGVDYSRHTFSTFAGLGINFKIRKLITIETNFLLSPYTYQYSYDYHHGVKHPFISEAIQESNFSKFKIGNKLDLHFTDNISIEFYTTFLFGNTDQGKLYTDYFTEKINYITDQKTGSNLRSTKFGLSAKIKLF